MTTGQRIRAVLAGLLTIAIGALMLYYPEEGFRAAAAILSVSLTLAGIRYLRYYFSMARHMVGGKMMLFVAIIALDLGAFTASLSNSQQIYVILYLLGIHAFSGAIDVLRGLEARRGGAPWKGTIAHGAINILVAAASIVFLRRVEVLTYIYCAGMVWSALGRIASAFRRTAIVYVQ